MHIAIIKRLLVSTSSTMKGACKCLNLKLASIQHSQVHKRTFSGSITPLIPNLCCIFSEVSACPVMHLYLQLRNTGPSRSTETDIVFNYPVETTSGLWLYYLVAVEVSTLLPALSYE